MDMGALIGASIVCTAIGGCLALAHWSTKKDREREARRRLIIDTYNDRPTLQRPKPAARKVPPAWPVPAKPSPPAQPILNSDEAVEHHAAEGVAAAQFMLDKVWRQKGHDQ